MNKRRMFIWILIGSPFLYAALPLQAQNSSANVFSACESFGVQRLKEKKEAPPFALKDLNGKQVSFSDLKGKPLLLFFWATWCPACKEDIPLLEKFSEGKKDQLKIISIVIDGEKEKRVEGIVKKNRITFPVLLDTKEKLARTYGVRMVPTACIISQQGSILGLIVGQRDWSKPEAWDAIKELLGQN